MDRPDIFLSLVLYGQKGGGSSVAVGKLVSQTHSFAESPPRMLLPAKLCIKTTSDNVTLPVTVLIDSGADDSFMDVKFAHQVGLETIPLEHPLVANALDGRQLAKVTQMTKPVELIISGNHHEMVSFKLISSPHSAIILGLPWLKLHNPHLDWLSCTILSWSTHCHTSCLLSAVSPLDLPACSPEPPDLLWFLSPTMTWVRFSVNIELSHCPLIGLTTVQLIFFLGLRFHPVGYTIFPDLRMRLWKNTSQTPLLLESSDRLPLQ